MTLVHVAQAMGSTRKAELLRIVGARALVRWPDTGRSVWISKQRIRETKEDEDGTQQ